MQPNYKRVNFKFNICMNSETKINCQWSFLIKMRETSFNKIDDKKMISP